MYLKHWVDCSRELKSFFSPDYLQGTFIFSLVKYTPLKFNNTTEYPWWGYALGWWFTLSSTLLVPILMLYNLSVTPGTLRQVSCYYIKICLQNSICLLLFLLKTQYSPLLEVLHPMYTSWRPCFLQIREESSRTARLGLISWHHGVLVWTEKWSSFT